MDRVRQALLSRPVTSREYHRRMAADDSMSLPTNAWEHGRAERIAAHEERRRTGMTRSSYGAIGSGGSGAAASGTTGAAAMSSGSGAAATH